MGTGGVFLRKLRARVSDEPTGFLWVEKDKVAASGYPASRRQIEWISKQRLNSILTLTEKPIPGEWVKGLPFTLEHVPMIDHEPPDLASLERAASYVEDQVRQGRRVLVHCLAGQGRTMCVLAAYLIKERRVSAEEAIRILRSLRPGAVESRQEKPVYDYAATMSEGPGRTPKNDK